MQVLNHYRTPEDPETSIENFGMAYPSASLHSEPINITASVHCELTVAMHKIKGSGGSLSPIEIGVSKECCYFCGAFIGEINKNRKQRLLVSGMEGKVHSGWRFLPETPLHFQAAIVKLVTKEVDGLKYFADSVCWSNVFPTPDFEDANDWEIELSVDDIKALYECLPESVFRLRSSHTE